MKRSPAPVVVLLLVVALLGRGQDRDASHDPAPRAPAPSNPDNARITATLSRLPVRFEANAGQWDERVRFVARRGGATLFLTDEGMTFGLREEVRTAAVTIRLVGAKGNAPVGEHELITRSNFFLGNDATRWRTDVPNYAKVRHAGWLPGVEVVWHGHGEGGELEYDLEVAAGVDARELELDVEGATSLGVAEDGSLEVATEAGMLVQRAPRVVQAGKEIATRYVIARGRRVRFALDRYDARLAVLIDPALTYSTYLGGAGTEEGYGIAVDGTGSAYVTGNTSSTSFPKQGPFQASHGGGTDAFVSKLNAAGTALVYSTYLGGSDADLGYGIAVDGSGSAYVTGLTLSTNFPTQSPFQASHGGGADAFVSKLNAAGTALAYSTYLGGAGTDVGRGIAVDGTGSAYVTGNTSSANLPTQSPFQATFGGVNDAFVGKLDAAGAVLVYATYLGGARNDIGHGIAVDASGSAYITGQTNSTNFPTQSPFQASNAGVGGSYDAFVSKLNAAGTSLAYSTYLGGAGDDHGYGVAVDASGSAYITGITDSLDFPRQSPFQATFGGGSYDAFVSKLSSAGTSLAYSTYLGGSADDVGYGVAVDGDGSAHVTGSTYSTDFPTQRPLQAIGGGSDAFVSKLSSAGTSLAYSTHLGGAGFDRCHGMAVDGSGSAYVTGITRSTNFTTESPFQATFGGGNEDAFVSKLARAPGEACTSPAQCALGFCTFGLCCKTACAGGPCDRCDLPGSLGTCKVAPAGDPGANPACALPYACDGASVSCPTSCSSDAQCATSHHCAPDGTCKPRKAQAAACDTRANCKQPGCRECLSGFCADGVCCDAACTSCRACTTALKQNGGPDGVCGPAKDATDPHNECAPSSPPCGPDGECNGAGGCRLFAAAGVACGAGDLVCDGAGTCAAAGATCDGDHTLTGANKKPRDCAPYKCKQDGSCGTECTSVNDCVAPAVCDARGQCAAPADQTGDGGCAVGRATPGHSSWLLLALLALARRARTAPPRGSPSRP